MSGMTRVSCRWLGFIGILATAGCSVAPPYVRPPAVISASFKEGATGDWKAAEPSEQLPRGMWWKIFRDPVLDDLEAAAIAANQDLAAAAARLKESRAINGIARSTLFPRIGVGAGPTRERVSASSIFEEDGTAVPEQTFWRAQATASYDVDLFGRVSAAVAASRADVQRSDALFRSMRLMLEADVADNYFALRELDSEAVVYAKAISLREQALAIARRRFAEGDIDQLDVARAETELATAQSEAMTSERLRATSEHSLAVLVGKPPAELSVAPAPLKSIELNIPAGLPSSLLERRPDIDAAERAMAAANARVGVARAAFFPSLSLTGSAGFESASISNLFERSSQAFLLGPLVGTALNFDLFDGGRRKNALGRARAVYEEGIASYRQKVLQAFREVEDNLSDLRILKDQVRVQGAGVDAAERASSLVRLQYDEGNVDYLSVIDAERSTLTARRSEAQLRGLQARSTVALVRGLGGGWGQGPQQPSTSVNE